jgi:hypothetical protein
MAKKVSTAPAVVEVSTIAIPKTTKEVSATIANLKDQLKLLKGNKEEEISLDVDYQGNVIKNVETVNELLQISASLHARATAYGVELERYNLQDKKIQPFTESNLSVEKWEKVISQAIFELMNRKQIEKIESAIKSLSKFEDEETKLKNELENIMKSASELVQ